jgi:hypothetical protein
MNTGDAARRTAKAIGDLPANFMLDSATYETGNALGFDGLDFYVVGRGGTLGPVDAAIVNAVFVFFNPVMIRERWERGLKVMTAARAAQAFAGCLHDWCDRHLGPDLDYGRLAELAGTVVSAANPAGAPLFAGWLTLSEPEEPAALALHRINALRELRGALHGAAVLAAGLDPLVALLVKTPFMAGIFGWPGPHPDVELAREAWQAAEAATNHAMGRSFMVLSESERAEMAELLDAVHASVH